jgi:hypothetical protein
MPMPLNIWRAKRGKPAAVIERRKVFAAIADAALDMRLETNDHTYGRQRGVTYNMR